MREDVEKYAFIGAEVDRKHFFREAQREGIIHFIDLSQDGKSELPQEIIELTQTIKILRGLPTLDQVEPKTLDRAPLITKQILELKHSIDALSEEERVLKLELSRISAFGQFKIEDIRYLKDVGNREIRFYSAKQGAIPLETIPEEMLHIRSDHGLDYFVGIHKDPTAYDKMIVMHFDRSLTQVQTRMDQVKTEIALNEKTLKELAKYNTYLHRALVASYNHHHLHVNQEFVREEIDGNIFAVEGWVPVRKADALKNLINSCGVYAARIAIEEDDVVPTSLVNHGVGAIGEDLVHIYDTPSNTDKDPSLWVLSAFALFFAMIVGDAGYGLVYLGLTLYLRNRFSSAKGAGKRFLNLALILCVTCIGWGLLTHSFFGIEFPADSVVRKVSILNYLSEKKAAWHLQLKDSTYQEWLQQFPAVSQVQNVDQLIKATTIQRHGGWYNDVIDGLSRGILLELALLVGIIHIGLSFLRYLDRNWSGVGWIAVLIGGYLYFPYYLGETSLLHYAFSWPENVGESEGLQLMIGGLGVAVVLSIIQHKLMGLTEVMNVIQVFADVLSYLRLYALGLASTIVSETINQMAGALPILVAVILIAVAHLVNMALGIMSGVIHGLRLNFLEWYHYSFEGGGKLFTPLRLFEYD